MVASGLADPPPGSKNLNGISSCLSAFVPDGRIVPVGQPLDDLRQSVWPLERGVLRCVCPTLPIHTHTPTHSHLSFLSESVSNCKQRSVLIQVVLTGHPWGLCVPFMHIAAANRLNARQLQRHFLPRQNTVSNFCGHFSLGVGDMNTNSYCNIFRHINIISRYVNPMQMTLLMAKCQLSYTIFFDYHRR